MTMPYSMCTKCGGIVELPATTCGPCLANGAAAGSDPCPVEAVFPDQSLPCLLERGHEPPHKYTPDPCGSRREGVGHE